MQNVSAVRNPLHRALDASERPPDTANRLPSNHPNPAMTLLLLEALGALLLLVFIVWWTMFSGRKNGELPDSEKEEKKRLDGTPPKD